MTADTAVDAAKTATPAAGHRRGLIPLFCGLMLSMLVAALNQTVLATALPTMVGELDGVDQLPWVITAYLLAATVVLPVYGKIGDLIGRKRLLLAAIVLFMAGSLLGALAGGMTVLIAARAVQGLGGGGLILLTQAIVADVVPARERGKYMGPITGVFAFASVAGPLLGGWFTEGPGWRWAFWINLPLGALALAVVLVFLHLPKGQQTRPRLDYLGMALLIVVTTCLVLIGTWGGLQYAWASPPILGLAAGALIGGLLLVLVERRAAEPIMPLHLFHNRDFNLTTLAGLLTGVAMFGAIGYMPTYFQMAARVDATQAGLLMLPMMASLLITSVLGGFYVSRTGHYRALPVAGSVVLAGALALLGTVTATSPVWLICLYLSILGAGLGTTMQLLVLVVQNSFPLREVGTATAANNYFRQVGASLGSAVVGSLFTSRLLGQLAERLPGADAIPEGAASLTPEVLRSLPASVQNLIVTAYNAALMPIFLVMAPLGIAAAIMLCFLSGKPLATNLDPEDAPDVGEPAGQGVGRR